MPMPGVERVARRVEAHRLAVEHDLALVRPVEAGEDVRERALAGAVLAEQRVHLARGRLEVDARRWRRTPGKRFVIPRSATAGIGAGAAVGATPGWSVAASRPTRLLALRAARSTPLTSQFIA